MGRMEPTRLDPPSDLIDIVCPRCAEPASERLYGPCGACRDVLRATLGGVQREVAAEEYVPKVNVTPNAVATKD
jgi:cytidine deaminase